MRYAHLALSIVLILSGCTRSEITTCTKVDGRKVSFEIKGSTCTVIEATKDGSKALSTQDSDFCKSAITNYLVEGGCTTP